MFHSFVAFLATVYNATPLAATATTLHPTDNFAMANSTTTNSSSSSTSSSPTSATLTTATNNNNNNTSTNYRPSPHPIIEPIRHTRRRLLFSTTSTPTTPTLRRHPWTPELSRSRFTPPRDEQEQQEQPPPALTDQNWLTNRRFVRGDRLERAGPQDNLMLLAAEQAELNAQRALETAIAEQQQDRRTPQVVFRQPQLPQQHQQLESYYEVSEYPTTTSSSSSSYQPLLLQQHQQQQRMTTVAVTPQLESFITDATYVPSVNISSSSSASEDEQFVLQLPARDARLAGQSVAEWAGSRKTTKQRYAGSKRSFSDYLEEHDDDENRSEEPRTFPRPTTSTSQNNCYLKMMDENKWRNTQKNVERMDDMYNTTFATWVQAEENAFTTTTYLKRLAYEYPLERLIHVIKWIITDWRLQSIATLIKHVISDWDFENSHLNVARLLREVTEGWEQMECVTSLVADVMAFRDEPDAIKAAFLKSLCKNWDFSRLSAFLMRLDNNIDHKIKCELLHRAAQMEQRKIEVRMSKRRRTTNQL